MGRFRRALLGYRCEEVDTELDSVAQRAYQAQERASAADQELLLMSEMLISREREIADVRAQLERAQERHDRSLRSLEVLARQIDELHAQARGQATRIRMKALNDAVKVSERAGGALGAIKEIEDAAAGLRQSAASEVDSATSSPGTHSGLRAVGAEDEDFEEMPITIHKASDDAAEVDPGMYEGSVEVEIGPLGDFSQLLGFETAAGSLRGLDEISVRRFAGGRATLGLRLGEPIELLRELEELAPFEFRVRQTGGDRLVLDIEDESATEAS